jgi:hypothetical protein
MERGEMSKSAFSRAQVLLIAAHTDRQNLLAAREAVDLNFDRSQYCQNYNESLSGSRVNVFA